MKGVVLKPFPFAFDGNTFTHLKVDDDFPKAGYSVSEGAFAGLADAGYIKATISSTGQDDIDLNKRLIDAIDKRLGGMSDEDLKRLIARRGSPFSGNMVHAVLISEAKTQLLAEYEGAELVELVDPNAGITEQPLSAPGQATPPSAATEVAAQQARQQAASEQQQSADDGSGGKESASGIGNEVGEQGKQQSGGDGKKNTDQFGEEVDFSKSNELSEAELNAMNKADLEAYAATKGVDLSQAKTKSDYVDALKPKSPAAEA